MQSNCLQQSCLRQSKQIIHTNKGRHNKRVTKKKKIIQEHYGNSAYLCKARNTAGCDVKVLKTDVSDLMDWFYLIAQLCQNTTLRFCKWAMRGQFHHINGI